MDKLTHRAFEKMQKREHALRATRERWALGRMTQSQFREEEREINRRYELTEEERNAYEYQKRLTQQRKR